MIRNSSYAVFVSLVTPVAFFAILVAVALWMPRDQQAVRQHLVDAIVNGEINAPAWYGPLQRAPVDRNTYNCLLFNMMLAPSTGPAADAMSNRMVLPDLAAHDARVPGNPDCQSLLRALPEFGGSKAEFIQYDRYILGMRVLGRELLSVLSVQALQRVLLATAYALLAAIGIVACFRFYRAKDDAIERARAAGFAAIAACLALFYGAYYFDATLNFGPMDCVQYIFILIGLICPLAGMSALRLGFYAASYGSLIAIFEFMTGGIPLALALLPLLLGLGFRGDRRSYLEKLALLWGCFCIAVVVSFAAKQFFVVAFIGGSGSFVTALLHRTYGGLEEVSEAQYSLIYLLKTYHVNSWLIGWGSRFLGTAAVVTALAAVVLLTARGRRADPPLNRPVLNLACWLSLAALAAWVLVFLNHTTLHAHFMARLLVIPLLSGGVLVATEAVVWLSRKSGFGVLRLP